MRRSTAEQLLCAYAATHDVQVLGDLYEATALHLMPAALAITRERSLAEDAVHDAFVDLFRHAGRYDPSRPALPWLVGIVRRKALKLRRQEQRRVVPSRLTPPPEPSELNGKAEEVARAIDSLRDDYRVVARLRWQHGLTPQEIAALRNERPGTTRSLLFRGLPALKRLLESVATLLLLVIALPRWLLRGRVPGGQGVLASTGGAASTGVLPLALAGAVGICTGWLALGRLVEASPTTIDLADHATDPLSRIHQSRPVTPEVPTAR